MLVFLPVAGIVPKVETAGKSRNIVPPNGIDYFGRRNMIPLT
jgi:hypothetical protein